jgi:ribonuclease HI/transposase InsO family protein
MPTGWPLQCTQSSQLGSIGSLDTLIAKIEEDDEVENIHPVPVGETVLAEVLVAKDNFHESLLQLGYLDGEAFSEQVLPGDHQEVLVRDLHNGEQQSVLVAGGQYSHGIQDRLVNLCNRFIDLSFEVKVIVFCTVLIIAPFVLPVASNMLSIILQNESFIVVLIVVLMSCNWICKQNLQVQGPQKVRVSSNTCNSKEETRNDSNDFSQILHEANLQSLSSTTDTCRTLRSGSKRESSEKQHYNVKLSAEPNSQSCSPNTVKRGSHTYTDSDLREITSTLRSPRPFFHARFDNGSVYHKILGDCGSSVDLMAHSLFLQICRARGESIALYRSTCTVSGLGDHTPTVLGLAIIDISIDSIQLPAIPFIITDRLTESTLCLLGCRSLCRMNTEIRFREDGEVTVTVDIHGQKSQLQVEMLATEVYEAFTVQDTILYPRAQQELVFCLDGAGSICLAPDHPPITLALHQSYENLSIISTAIAAGTNSLAVVVQSDSSDPICIPKNSCIGFCSPVSGGESDDVSYSLITDQLALQNQIFERCPCNLPNRIFLTSYCGATGFEGKYTLLSPFSNQPPTMPLVKQGSNIFIVENRHCNLKHITRDMVHSFCDRNNITLENTFYVIYNYAGAINLVTGTVISYFMEKCHVGFRLVGNKCKEACPECSSFRFLNDLHPKMTYPFRTLNIWLITSRNVFGESKRVKDSAIFTYKLHGTYMQVLCTGGREMSVYIHFIDGISKKLEYYKFILISLITQLKPLLPLVTIKWHINETKGSLLYNLMSKALTCAASASRYIPDYFMASMSRSPKQQDTIVLAPVTLELPYCICLFCTRRDRERTHGRTLLATNTRWPAMQPSDVLVSHMSGGEGRCEEAARRLTQGFQQDICGTFVDHSLGRDHPRQGIINKHTPPEEKYFDYYDLSGYSDLEKFYIRAIFRRFGPTTLAFERSDSAVVTNILIDITLKPNSKLVKSRPIPLSGTKLNAAIELVRDMEVKGLARISRNPICISQAFPTFKSSEDKLLAARGEPHKYRLVIAYMAVNKIIECDFDASKSYFSNVLNLLTVASGSKAALSLLDHASAFNSLLLSTRSGDALSFCIPSYSLMSPTTLSLGLAVSPTLYCRAIQEILAQYGAQRTPDPRKLISELLESAEIMSRAHKQVTLEKQRTGRSPRIDPTKTLFKREAPKVLRVSPSVTEVKSTGPVESLHQSILQHCDDLTLYEPESFKLDEQTQIIRHFSKLYLLLCEFEARSLLVRVDKLSLYKRTRQKILGLEVGDGRIYVPQDKVDHLKLLSKQVTSRAALSSLLGAFIFISPFIKSFSLISEPLYKLLKKGVEFKLTDTHLKAIDYLTQSALEAPCLFQLIPDLPLVIVVDSCSVGFSGVLLQCPVNAQPHIVRFVSGLFHREFVKKASSSAIAELAGLVQTLLSAHYLVSYVRDLILVCDCSVVCDLLSKANAGEPTTALSRLAFSLMSFNPNFLVRHSKNTSHYIKYVDYFSRILQPQSAGHRIKAHTGNVGNEMADELANVGSCEARGGVDFPWKHYPPFPFQGPTKDIISSQELMEYASTSERTCDQLGETAVNPEDQLIIVNIIDTFENMAVSNCLQTFQSPSLTIQHRGLSQVYDCLSIGSQCAPKYCIKLPDSNAPLPKAFEICTASISTISNPLSRYQSLQFLSLQDIISGQQSDSYCKTIYDTLLRCKKTKSKIPSKYSMYVLVEKDTALARNVKTKSGTLEPRLVLTIPLLVHQTSLLHSLSHVSANRIYQQIKQYFYSSHALEIITELVKSCRSCTVYNKVPNTVPAGRHPLPQRPLQHIQIDICYFPRNQNSTWNGRGGQGAPTKFYSVFVMVCVKTGFITARILSNESVSEIIKSFDLFFINTSVVIEQVSSDQGRNLLQSKALQQYLFQRGIKKIKLGLVYHSQSQNFVENSNKLLKRTLFKLKYMFPSMSIQKLLVVAVTACNTAMRRFPSLGRDGKLSYTYVSPYEMVFHQRPYNSMQKVLSALGMTQHKIEKFIQEQSKYIDNAHRKLNQLTDKELPSKYQFENGTLVLLSRAVPQKHMTKYEKSIYQVLSQTGRQCLLKNLSIPDQKLQRVHIDRLKRIHIGKYYDLLPQALRKYYGKSSEYERVVPDKSNQIKVLKRSNRSRPSELSQKSTSSWSSGSVPAKTGPAPQPPTHQGQGFVPHQQLPETVPPENQPLHAAGPVVQPQSPFVTGQQYREGHSPVVDPGTNTPTPVPSVQSHKSSRTSSEPGDPMGQSSPDLPTSPLPTASPVRQATPVVPPSPGSAKGSISNQLAAGSRTHVGSASEPGKKGSLTSSTSSRPRPILKVKNYSSSSAVQRIKNKGYKLRKFFEGKPVRTKKVSPQETEMKEVRRSSRIKRTTKDPKFVYN